MNALFTALFLVALAFAAATGHMAGFSTGLFAGVKNAVDVAIGLTGALALWLGLVKILERAGAVAALSRAVGPVVRWIFPGLPREHPAIAAMTLNIAANMLGLGNAATPFGLKAMEELDRLNPKQQVASDVQALFLAVNTANVTLVPATIIALRATASPHPASQPADIVLPTLVASACATGVAILAGRLLAKLPGFRRQLDEAPDKVSAPAPEEAPAPSISGGA